MNYIKRSHKIGIFFGLLFAICFVWFFINPVESTLHMDLFKLSFLGFNDMNFTGFVLGFIQSYIWAYIAVAIWKLAGKLSFVKK